MEPDDLEHQLTGGNVAGNVVRVGMTVRKPATAATANVEAFLRHLAQAGFPHAPRSLGRDKDGRHVLEFIEGETVSQPELLTLAELRHIGAIIRTLHHASATFPISSPNPWSVAIRPDAEELICHNDLAPWNLVRNGSRWVFIDWDGSGPSTRLWDLAYAVQSFVPLIAGGSPEGDASRLRAFVEGYSLNQRERQRLPSLLVKRTQASYRLLADGAKKGVQPWSEMYVAGHGEHWRKAAAYVEEHQDVWSSALSF